MSTINEQMEDAHEKMDKTKVVAIRPALSLVGGGGGIGGNWLHDLPVDAYFLCRPVGTTEHRSQLMAFIIDWKDNDSFAVRMHSALNEPREFWVDSIVFSEENSLYMWRTLNEDVPGE